VRIRNRAYLLGLLPALLVAAVLGIYLGVVRLADLQDEIQARGRALVKHLAIAAEYGVVSGNRADLQGLVAEAKAEPDVVYVQILDAPGAMLARAGKPKAGQIAFSAPVIPRLLTPVVDPYLPDAQTADKPIGWVNLILSRERYEAARNRMLLTAAGIVLLGLVFAALLVRGLALSGIQPLVELIAAVRRMAAGDLTVSVPVTAKSELRDLQTGFNEMSAALLSYRDRMQHKIDRATAELASQKMAAETANAAKSHFLAAASHDLRQPMHAIGLYVEAMKPLVAGRQAAATLDKLAASVTALEGLFNGILDVSKLDGGAIAPRLQAVPVREFLQNLADSHLPDAEHRGLALRVHACEGCIAADTQLLERILRNLLSNALRYTEHGGVLLAARRHGGKIRLQVWDTGVGIAPVDLPRIFDEFYQVHNPQRDRSQGLGLGLAIVRRMAALLDYPLEVRSRPGRGTVFSLLAPRCEPTPSSFATQSASADFTRLSGRIAVIDDDDQVLDALTVLLQGWGLDVIAAKSGGEALARLEVAPDVLITDWRLGGGETGEGVIGAVRAAYPGQRIGAVIVTGDTSVGSVKAARTTGLPVLHKPVQPARLRVLLAQMLRKRG